MAKRFFIILLLIKPFFTEAQDFSQLWQGYFSYNEVNHLIVAEEQLYAATQNAIFSYDMQTRELHTITTINGLSGQVISAIAYSPAHKLLLIGYQDGSMQIKFDNEQRVLSVLEIRENPNILPTNRGINHFNIKGDLVYIAADYGISVYNLARLEFGDTYFIGDHGSQISVTQTTLYEDHIYATCRDAGLRKAPLTRLKTIDFNQWKTLAAGRFIAITQTSNLGKHYLADANKKLYRTENDLLTEIAQYENNILKVKIIANDLIVLTSRKLFVYDTDFNFKREQPIPPEFQTLFTDAITTADGTTYIATEDFGVLKIASSLPTSFEMIRPEGPLRNDPFAIQSDRGDLWVAYGEYSLTFNPYPLDQRGLSHLKNNKWTNIPFEDLLGARELNAIAINPSKTSQVFISSFVDGLLEINNDLPKVLYNPSNSGLEGRRDNKDIRLGASAFDQQGLLWTLTSSVDSPLKSYNTKTDTWQSFSFKTIIPDGLKDNLGFSDLVIDPLGTKWVGSYKYGVIAYNETQSQPIKALYQEGGNLPSDFVTALALDQQDQLWVGTLQGLRVIYDTAVFFQTPTQANKIIITEEGTAKELLFQQYITSIEIDNSDNKWVGTNSSGVFCFSPDGQKTIFHFTTDNSPLPSNRINAINLDQVNGVVYIATNLGLVAFKSGGSKPVAELQNSYVYPNPVRPEFDIVGQKVTIKGLSENVNIKITDVEGNLVTEAQSQINKRYNNQSLEIDGGTAYWNGQNLAGHVVASGVYLIILSDLENLDTKILKLLIVR